MLLLHDAIVYIDGVTVRELFVFCDGEEGEMERLHHLLPLSVSLCLCLAARKRPARCVRGAESCGSQGYYPSLSSLRRAAYAFDTRIKG